MADFKRGILDLLFPAGEPHPQPPGPAGGGPPAPATGVERTRDEWVLEGCLACDHYDPSRCACGGGHACHWKILQPPR